MLKRAFNLLVMALGVVLLGISESGCTSTEAPGHPDWMTSLPQALTKAKAEHKLVLMDFTGSDWCAPCRELHDRVFETANFKNYADSNLVLVVVDFPEHKAQSAEERQTNEALKKQFDVPGYPTIILLDGDGKVLTKQTGIDADHSSQFIAWLEKAAKKS